MNTSGGDAPRYSYLIAVLAGPPPAVLPLMLIEFLANVYLKPTALNL